MTDQQLAEALGITTRTLARLRTRGLTPPAEGESTEAWVVRATKWRQADRRKPGPKAAADSSTAAMLRYRLAKAELAELDVQVRKGELHSRRECEALETQRLGEMRSAFAQTPDTLARKLYQAPSPEAIKMVVEEELRRCFEVLARGGGDDAGDGLGVDAGDARRPPVA